MRRPCSPRSRASLTKPWILRRTPISVDTFPNNFTWGAATAAYQIEGFPEADGKGPSVWDHFARQPHNVKRNENGDTACEHYQRYQEDTSLMQQIGLQGYRFSLSWPRLIPHGIGARNAKGFAFYDALIDRLLEKGIEPWVTLFHWDLPLALQQKGGWQNPDMPKWFADYATAAADAFGDRVGHWITLNEPQMFVWLGHQIGTHAPGLKLPISDLARIIHHVLLAHGQSVQAIRGHAKAPHLVGWAPSIAPFYLSDETDEELVAYATKEYFALEDVNNAAFMPAVWNDAAMLGRYPETFVEAFGKLLPGTWQDDLVTIAQPLDFCGLNVYMCQTRFERDAAGNKVCVGSPDFSPAMPRTQFDWPMTPEALYWGPKLFHDRYQLPIVVTENGVSCADWVALDGAVHDPNRIDFTHRYLRQLQRAIADGVDVRGYFHWSLMDNFEWAEGYHQRFGLIHVDQDTQVRTLKDSALWYRGVIESNGASL